MIVAYFAIGLGSTVAILSFFIIRWAANRPANGELKELAELDRRFSLYKDGVAECALKYIKEYATKRNTKVLQPR